ncbi:MAG TPA: hypothetical protein VKA82_22965, partial [Rubrobacter sp.]|nr:hypothetical protein [Rubrobacter sp.]
WVDNSVAAIITTRVHARSHAAPRQFITRVIEDPLLLAYTTLAQQAEDLTSVIDELQGAT